MKRIILITFLGLLTIILIECGFSQSHGMVEVGDVVFKTSFDEQNALVRWTKSKVAPISLVNEALRVSLPADGDEKNALIIQKLPSDQLRGTRLRISGRIKAENVEKPPQHYNGIKIVLILDGPDGKQWLQRDEVWGTFDWKEVVFLAAVPENITDASLLLGIENTTGTAWFDDITITVIGKKPSADTLSPPVYKGHDLPRLRGTMIYPDTFKPEDLKVLAGDWKANHIRWQLLWEIFPDGPANTATVEEFDAWIDKQCKQLDRMIPELERYGVRIALALQTPPGGRVPKQNAEMRMFREKQFQDAFVATWQKLAHRYKDVKMVWCYDLMNEPVEGKNIPEGLLDWRALALKTSKEIRRIDPDKAIVIEPAPWGEPSALEWFEPFDSKEVPNVVYSVHMYTPHDFTHQGVNDLPIGLIYPGRINIKYWDKKQLRNSLRPVREFVQDYGVAIYIGEFGSIRWAPDNSSYRYLKDCIEIFEEEGWDWAYHSFREWDGWSVEHGTDKNNRQPVAEPTDREMLLRSWFEINER